MSRVPGLDLLRAVAIAWVMYYHALVLGLLPETDQVAKYGWMGVDLFFALSGYLIGGQLFRPYAKTSEGRPKARLGRFYVRRIFRTLPAYLVVVGLYFTVPIFRERREIQPLWQFLTFTENLLIDFHHAKAFSHVWSLCVEEHFYLVAPLVVWVAMRRPAAWKAVLLVVFVILGGVALRAHIWAEVLAPTQNTRDFSRLWSERIYYPTWTRLDGLTAGVVLALIANFRPAWWRVLMARADVIGLVGLVGVAGAICMFRDERAQVPVIFGYPLLSFSLAALVCAAASPTGFVARLRIPGSGPLAVGAYSLYLTHKQVYHMVHVAVGDALDAHPAMAFLTYALAALAAGGLLYWAVERPFLKLRDRLEVRPVQPEARAAQEPAL